MTTPTEATFRPARRDHAHAPLVALEAPRDLVVGSMLAASHGLTRSFSNAVDQTFDVVVRVTSQGSQTWLKLQAIIEALGLDAEVHLRPAISTVDQLFRVDIGRFTSELPEEDNAPAAVSEIVSDEAAEMIRGTQSFGLARDYVIDLDEDAF